LLARSRNRRWLACDWFPDNSERSVRIKQNTDELMIIEAEIARLG
jgi:hypothetical protein